MRLSATILFLSLLNLSTCFPVLKTLTINQKVLELVTSVSNTWKIVSGNRKFTDSSLNKKEKILMSKIDHINARLEKLDGDELKSEIEAIDRTLKDIPNQILYQDLSLQLKSYGHFISISYDKLKKYAEKIEDYEKSTLIDFSDAVVWHRNNSVLSLLNKIHYHIVINPTFLQLLQRRLTQSSEGPLCLEKSPQQTFYSFLERILMVNSIGYLTVQSAYMIKKMYGEGNFTREAEDVTEQFKSTTNAYVSTFKMFMSNSSREVWKCDPKQHIRGKTYVEIIGLLQGYILNQVNLQEKEECTESCSSYTYTTTHECDKNEWCSHQGPACPKIVDCQLIDKDMTVCKTDLESSGRRYKYVEHANGRRFGQVTSCPRENKQHLSSYKFWVVWECDYCFCLCDLGDNSTDYSDRYINLRASMADIRKNKLIWAGNSQKIYILNIFDRVVTGLRFVKHNRIIHLQVQEGKLLPGGQIDPSTVHWVPPEDYTILDRYIYKGQDYHVLTWENRGFDLKTIMADKGSIVTGVRFRRLGTRIDLEVFTTPFNITTGKLRAEGSYFKDNLNYSIKSKLTDELKLHKPDIPTRSRTPSKPNTSTNKYIRFVNSDYDKDAAQSTVPFFDAQPVESSVPVPLSGVGVYHKGRPGSGGFIAPKIITYDFTEHLEPVFRLEKKK